MRSADKVSWAPSRQGGRDRPGFRKVVVSRGAIVCVSVHEVVIRCRGRERYICHGLDGNLVSISVCSGTATNGKQVGQ